MTEPAYLTLQAAAENLRKQLVERRDTKWHDKQGYERLQYRIGRLQEFERYCALRDKFD